MRAFSPLGPRTSGPLVLGLLLLCASSTEGQAQTDVGAAQCFKCHASSARKAWEAFHKKSGSALDAPDRKEKAQRYAAPAGGNTHAPRCLECHAPAGSPDRTVSCEACHGPGSAYRKPHARADFYRQPESQWLGMRNHYGPAKAEATAQLCVGCHVLDPKKDGALAAAGHPTGRDFDPLGPKLEKMKHWPSRDDDDGGGPLSRPRAYAASYYAAVTSAASGPVRTRVAALPAPAPVAPGAAATPRPASAPAVVDPSADPFFAEVVEDYVPGSLAKPAAPPTPPAPRTIARSEAPDAPTGGALEPALAPPAPVAPAPPQAGAKVLPQDAAALQGRLLVLVDRLVKGSAAPTPLATPAPVAVWTGKDGEMLRLQDEALRLALEVLRDRR